jgi:DNA-binding CsgD family transcriptional regulator
MERERNGRKIAHTAASVDDVCAVAEGLFGADNLARVKADGVDRLVRAIDADGSILVYSTTDRGVARISHHFADVAAIEDTVRPFRLELFRHDPVFAALSERMAARKFAAVDMADLPDIAQFRGSETYRSIYEQHGLRQAICAAVAPVAGTIAVMALYRTDVARRFAPSDLALVESVMPMLGETIRRIALTDALVGRLGAQPIDADLTLRQRIDEGELDQLGIDPGLSRQVPVFSRASVLEGELDRVDTRLATLSKREREIAHMVSEGQTNPQIAHQAGISRKTVEIHVSAVLRKLELNNRTELAYLVQALNARAHELRAMLARPAA